MSSICRALVVLYSKAASKSSLFPKDQCDLMTPPLEPKQSPLCLAQTIDSSALGDGIAAVFLVEQDTTSATR